MEECASNCKTLLLCELPRCNLPLTLTQLYGMLTARFAQCNWLNCILRACMRNYCTCIYAGSWNKHVLQPTATTCTGWR